MKWHWYMDVYAPRRTSALPKKKKKQKRSDHDGGLESTQPDLLNWGGEWVDVS
jgi:hypothetical protein